VLEQLRGTPDFDSIAVIVFSGLRSAEAEQRVRSLGACEFVHKSLRGSELVEAIGVALLVAVVAQHVDDVGLAAQAPARELPRRAA
jgi:DNA-binding response OmpR family regulator